jgi:hypothetical protein
LEGVLVLRQEGVGTENFIADNSVLKSNTPGLGFRSSKKMDDKYALILDWGSSIKGFDEGDGWVRVEDKEAFFSCGALEKLSESELRNLAKEKGLSAKVLEDADNAEDTKSALIVQLSALKAMNQYTWTIHPQYDLPNFDAGNMPASDIEAVKKRVVDEGLSGFCVYDGTAYLKKAEKQVTSEDLQSMGPMSSVTFYLRTRAQSSKSGDEGGSARLHDTEGVALLLSNNSVVKETETNPNLEAKSPDPQAMNQCTWTTIAQYDFPDHDAGTMPANDIEAVKKFVIDQGYSGFCVYAGTAYLKKADRQLTSSDLQSMGFMSTVTFYLPTRVSQEVEPVEYGTRNL